MKLTVDCAAFKPVTSGSLIGFASVRVRELRMVLHDVGLHRRDAKKWVSLPSKPMIGRDGVALRGEDGKVKYQPLVEIDDKATRDGFSTQVWLAVERFRGQRFESSPQPDYDGAWS
jgi:hypothetical protein